MKNPKNQIDPIHENIFASKKWKYASFYRIYHDSKIPLDSKSVGSEKW